MTPRPSPQPPPTATYRLQLQPDFPFTAAEQAVPGLARLGVSHLHLSPVLTAVPGSTHGYDITDHSTVREELGGEGALRALSSTARAHGLGLIVDIVPNHMAVPEDLRLNRPLWETLRDGPESAYAHWFDVEWEAATTPDPSSGVQGSVGRSQGRMLLPVLGGPLGEELPQLHTADDGTLRYGSRVLPLRTGTEQLPLPALLDAQHYRLAWWRLARTDLNYRRFFTITDLIGLRVEDPTVFRETHRTVLRLLHEGVVDGLRVDHPDGLADPGGYFTRLHQETGGCWTVAEKVLAADEQLPADWPVAGTTGYDALRHLDGLLTDPAGLADLTAHYRDFTSAPADTGGSWQQTARKAAHQYVRHELAAETARLTRTALRVCEAAPDATLRDHSTTAVRDALEAVLVRLPVYRPYVTAGEPARETDVALLERAAEGARQQCAAPDMERAVLLVRDLALGALGDGEDQRDFTARFAQLASAVHAKSVEDTAGYRYVPLLSGCEVGQDPGSPTVSPNGFHTFCAHRQRHWPAAATVLSTHDTKRSGDVRAALTLLTECPVRWAAFLADPQLATATDHAPDRRSAWTGWQTALGLGGLHQSGSDIPTAVDRLADWLVKAAREAGLHTAWTRPNSQHEEQLRHFATAAAQPPAHAALTELLTSLNPYLRTNMLGATLLQLTMPGVPDLYQGTEHLSRTLTDPDNRAPYTRPVTDDDRDELSLEKLQLTRTALHLRRQHPEWFGPDATYQPLHADGDAAHHCVAFTRSGQAVTAVTRLGLRLHESGGWRDTTLPLPDGTWQDLLSGRQLHGRCRVAALFVTAPVALLVHADS